MFNNVRYTSIKNNKSMAEKEFELKKLKAEKLIDKADSFIVITGKKTFFDQGFSAEIGIYPEVIDVYQEILVDIIESLEIMKRQFKGEDDADM